LGLQARRGEGRCSSFYFIFFYLKSLFKLIFKRNLNPFELW
jgi:hypothetical protein